MKEFRKNNEGNLVCEECEKIFSSQIGLGTHIGMIHNSKLYYDKWIKEKDEDICKICSKKTKFSSKITRGYYKTCSKKCENKNRVNTIKQTLIKTFGVENISQLKETKEKKRQTYLKHFGVDNNMKNKNNFEKQQKSAKLLKYFKDTTIYYRGSFELDFLEKYQDLFPDIINPESVKYLFEGKQLIYHPDFFIPLLNLTVEIKNSYLANKDKFKIEAKEKAIIANGFKYIMIVDKDYTDFTKYISNMKT
jgi:hypothetical protein